MRFSNVSTRKKYKEPLFVQITKSNIITQNVKCFYSSFITKVFCLLFFLIALLWADNAYDENLVKAQEAYNKSNYQDAIKLINNALELKEDDPAYYLLRGMIYSKLGSKDLAFKDFTSAINLKPDYVMAYYQRGSIYQEMNKLDSALQDYSKALEFSPKNAQIYQKRYETYLMLGQKNKAIDELTKILEFGTLNNYTELLMRADETFLSAETTVTMAYLNRAISIDSTKWEAFAKRGYVNHFMKRNDLSDFDYSMAIKLASSNLEDTRKLGEWFSSVRQYDWLIKFYSLMEKFNKTDPELNVGEAYAYFYLKKPDSSLTEFSNAILKYLATGDLKNAAEMYFRRGEVYCYMKQFYEANVSFAKAKEMAPKTEFKLKLTQPAELMGQDSTKNILAKIVTSEPVLKGETITEKFFNPASIETPPLLVFECSIIDDNQDKILDGGEKVILKIRVMNQGEGIASGVKVTLSGNSKALNFWGHEKVIDDIPPHSEKEVILGNVLPYQIEPDEGNIIIRVTEAHGFGALEEKELKIAMQPAKIERTTEVVSALIDVDQPLTPTSFRRENAYAVVVGITNYRSNRIPKVEYAKRDAESMRDYLTNICGIPIENIMTLIDDKATLSDLTAYIEEWLKRNVRKNSFVFVYYAGHGTPNPEKGDAYLVPYDGEPGFISKLYPLSRLYSSLDSLPSENIVVALDACFSGAGGRSVIEEGKRPLPAVNIEKVGRKVAALTAAAGDEISQDLNTKRHGLFTYFLLKGLKGEADANGDTLITLRELYNYAKPKIEEESRKLGYTQTPQIFPDLISEKSDIVIAKIK